MSGAAGAIVLNIVHESARHLAAQAPRVDRLGEQALAETIKIAGAEPPDKLDDLYLPTLVGDLVSNSLYYALVAYGSKETAILKGALLGAVAGVGAVYLPDKIGLRKSYTAASEERAALTIAWYLAGGIAAGASYKLLSADDD